MADKPHPLHGFDLDIKSIKCFDNIGSSAFSFAPITFIIGKNNSGKSTIIDVLKCMSRGNAKDIFENIARMNEHPLTEISKIVDRVLLFEYFPENKRGGEIPGRNHLQYAEQFLNKKMTWAVNGNWEASFVDCDVPDWDRLPAAIKRLDKCFNHPMSGNWSLRIHAERDVAPEKSDPNRSLTGTGLGLTNLVRAFINSDDLPRQAVEIDLLRDLNSIYLGDCEFTQILCQENEKDKKWEIYLREEDKGDIRLSQSGSSLKTAFIITAFLRLFPQVSANQNVKDMIFCVEEGFVAQIAGRDSHGESKMLPGLHEQTHIAELQDQELA